MTSFCNADRNDLVKEEKLVIQKKEAGIAGWVSVSEDEERDSNGDMDGLVFDKVMDSLSQHHEGGRCIKRYFRRLEEDALRVFGRSSLIASVLSGKLVERSSTGRRMDEELQSFWEKGKGEKWFSKSLNKINEQEKHIL